ncbi:MAG: type II toxin-antitoxin system VapC family toxin [Pseudomonadales bacterium]
MSAERVTYVDSSAIVKLAVREPESAALKTYLRRRQPLVCSALARTEVIRALLPLGDETIRRGKLVLSRFELVRLGLQVLDQAGILQPRGLRSLDAIHLATADLLGDRDQTLIVTYDRRMAQAAADLGWRVAAPA